MQLAIPSQTNCAVRSTNGRLTPYSVIACAGFLLAVLLAGCASPPPTNATFFYRGVYAPGATTIAEDGSFVSTSKVAEADQIDIAGEAAMMRLVKAAGEKGLAYAVVAGVRTDDQGGHGYRIEGNLYDASNAPPEAVAISEIETALARHGARNGECLPKECPSKPAFAVPATKEADEPVVIRAPDFVS